MDTEQKKYTLKIENFEGPLDLLYHLIEKNKMSIYDIRISEIADQYLEYFKEMKKLDLEITSEFVVMASTMLYIKSRSLLPAKPKELVEGELDPEEEIVLKLIEYKKYKEMTQIFRDREEEWAKLYYNDGEDLTFDKKKVTENLPVSTLFSIYKNIFIKNDKKKNKNASKIDSIIAYEKVSLKSKIRDVLKSLMVNTVVTFSHIFFNKNKSKTEIVTGFLAILELARSKKVRLEQKYLFDEIFIQRMYEYSNKNDMDNVGDMNES